MKASYKYFRNKKCRFFPCHEGIDPTEFNCLFCYCPLYALGKECGGRFRYTEKGIKDCSLCTLPHKKNGYDHIRSNIDKIIDMAKQDQ